MYWGKVVTLGMILGLSIQFVSAWTNPTELPPGGNVAGPLTTGAVAQEKAGSLTVGGTLTTRRMYDMVPVGDTTTFTQDSGFFSDPNGTSMINIVKVLGITQLYQTGGYALKTFGGTPDDSLAQHTKAKDPIGSLDVNDVYLRSTGKWASEGVGYRFIGIDAKCDSTADNGNKAIGLVGGVTQASTYNNPTTLYVGLALCSCHYDDSGDSFFGRGRGGMWKSPSANICNGAMSLFDRQMSP